MFKPWLRRIDQDSIVQSECISMLRVYVIRICQDIYNLEDNGPKSSWIWTVLCHWDYLTHSMNVPSPKYWNIGNTLKITQYQSTEPSRRDIVANLPSGRTSDSKLTEQQKQYLLKTASKIERKVKTY
jgi:hypothetical protein